MSEPGPGTVSDTNGNDRPTTPDEVPLLRVIPSEEPADPVEVGSMLGTVVPTREKLGVLAITHDAEIIYGFTAERCDQSLKLAIEQAFPASYQITRTTVELPHPQHGSPNGVRYVGQGDRPSDYLTPLEAAAGTNPPDPIDSKPIVLPSLLRTLVGKDTTGVYQALLTAPEPLTDEAHDYARRMKHSTPSWLGQLRRDLAKENENRDPIRRTHPSYQHRIDRIDAQSLVPTLAVNARLILSGPRSTQLCATAANQFSSISTAFYEVAGRTLDETDAHELYTDIRDETLEESQPTNIRGLRWLHNNASRCILTSEQSIPHFTLLDGSATNSELARALKLQDEGQAPPRPPSDDDLEKYR